MCAVASAAAPRTLSGASKLLLLRQAALVGGEWVSSGSSGGTALPVQNPATAAVIGSVPMLQRNQVHNAIDAALKHQRHWANINPRERAEVLQNLHGLMVDRQGDLADVIREEAGKALSDAVAEVKYSAQFVKFYAEEARRVPGEIVSTPVTSQRGLVIRQPVGVVGAITPWNFPLAMPARKVAPALAAGCSVVLKPSELTPFSAIAFADLALQAGLPSELFSVVTGDAQMIGAEITGSEHVRKLTFTGSTRIGKILMQQCADTVKKISLELGGNAPFIVFGDADVSKAVSDLVSSKLRSNGQVCIAPNRIMVHEDVADEFCEQLCAAVSGVLVGDPADERIDVGPLINANASNKARRHLKDALAKGAQVAAKAAVLEGCELCENYFIPTVITQVNPSMELMHEETFAPLFGLGTFHSEEEAMKICNDSPFGLAAYIYTKDVQRLFRVAEALEVGMVGANTSAIGADTAPFGGVKQSGLGRESGKLGLDEYLETKYVALGL